MFFKRQLTIGKVLKNPSKYPKEMEIIEKFKKSCITLKIIKNYSLSDIMKKLMVFDISKRFCTPKISASLNQPVENLLAGPQDLQIKEFLRNQSTQKQSTKKKNQKKIIISVLGIAFPVAVMILDHLFTKFFF